MSHDGDSSNDSFFSLPFSKDQNTVAEDGMQPQNEKKGETVARQREVERLSYWKYLLRLHLATGSSIYQTSIKRSDKKM